ncbi:MAG TPA: ABC transporter permease [Mycobacteriales bacterium]|jgi:osmoprotectant transport system permease protein|nr:ABC transporter permease [Mycobacteriales bacterium]
MGVIVDFLGNGANWSGSDGIPLRIVEHLEYTFVALLFVCAIALPLGLYVGHTGRGSVAIAGTANALRALPDFGLLVYVVLLISGSLPADLAYTLPTTIVLVVLGIPATLSATYAGIQNVDRAARDAAKGMGMTGGQVLWRVEVPNALPLIISGIRSSMLQIVATATIAAYVSLGGLGRFILDGQSQRDYSQMAAGAVLVGVLAILLDLISTAIQRLVVSPGVTGRFRTSAARRRPALIASGQEGSVVPTS